MAGGVNAVGGAGNGGGGDDPKIKLVAQKLIQNAKLTSEDIKVIRENKAEVLRAYNSNPKADYKSQQNFESFINNKHAELIIDKIKTNQPLDKYDAQLMVAKPAYFNDIEPTVLRSVLKEFLQNNQMSDALGSICIDCGGGPCDECGSTGKLLDMIDDAKDSSLKNKVMEKLLDSILDGTPKLGKEITKSIRSAVIDSVTKDELVSLINKNADDPKLKDAIKNEILQELSNPSRAHLTINDLKDIAKALNDPGFTLIVEDLESKGFKSLKDVPKDYKIPDTITTEINNLSEKIKPENVQKKVGSSYLNLLEKDGSFNDLHKNLIDELKVIVSKKELSESDIKQLNKIRSAINTKLKQEGKTDLVAKLTESTTKELKEAKASRVKLDSLKTAAEKFKQGQEFRDTPAPKGSLGPKPENLTEPLKQLSPSSTDAKVNDPAAKKTSNKETNTLQNTTTDTGNKPVTTSSDKQTQQSILGSNSSSLKLSNPSTSTRPTTPTPSNTSIVSSTTTSPVQANTSPTSTTALATSQTAIPTAISAESLKPTSPILKETVSQIMETSSPEKPIQKMLDALLPANSTKTSIPAKNIETLTTTILNSISQKGADSPTLQSTTQAILTGISTATATKEVSLPIAKAVATNPSLSPQVKADIIQTVAQQVVTHTPATQLPQTIATLTQQTLSAAKPQSQPQIVAKIIEPILQQASNQISSQQAPSTHTLPAKTLATSLSAITTTAMNQAPTENKLPVAKAIITAAITSSNTQTVQSSITSSLPILLKETPPSQKPAVLTATTTAISSNSTLNAQTKANLIQSNILPAISELPAKDQPKAALKQLQIITTKLDLPNNSRSIQSLTETILSSTSKSVAKQTSTQATQQANTIQQASPLQAKATATIATLISAQSQSPQQTTQVLISTFSNVVQTTPQIVPSLMTHIPSSSVSQVAAKLNISQAQLSSITSSLQSVITDMSSKLNTILSKATGENALSKAEINHVMTAIKDVSSKLSLTQLSNLSTILTNTPVAVFKALAQLSSPQLQNFLQALSNLNPEAGVKLMTALSTLPQQQLVTLLTALSNLSTPQLTSLLSSLSSLNTPQLTTILSSLAKLPPQQLANLLTSLSSIQPQQLTALLTSLSSLPPQQLTTLLTILSSLPKQQLTILLTSMAQLKPEQLQVFTQILAALPQAQLTTFLQALSSIAPKELMQFMQTLNSMPKEAIQAFMTAIASLKPEQILALLKALTALPKEALQAFFKALGSLKPEQVQTLIQVLGNLSPEKLASFMKLLSSLKPEQVQVLIKALGSLPKESLQLLLNSPQLLATIANLSPKNLQALLANLSNISPKLLANVMQLLQAAGLNSKQMVVILNEIGKLFANQNGKLNEEQLMQALKLKGFTDNPKLMQELLKLLNSEMNKPELLNVQMKALKEMQGLEDASINLAGAVAGSDEADKRKKLADKFISANNLRGMLVAKDAMSKAFALLFGKAFDTTQLNEVLGGLGEWEEYYQNMKKKKEKDEQNYKAKVKSNFENLQKSFNKTFTNSTLQNKKELVTS